MSSKPKSLISILWMVRDAANTEGAERALLNALVLRAKPEKGYSCFPSYTRLALDTRLHPVTCKRSARKLEQLRLISRRGRGHHSNIFFINVALLEELATAAREQSALERAASQDAQMEVTPFEATGSIHIRAEEDQPEHEVDNDAFISGGGR